MEGPTIRHIPARTIVTCRGCQYHDHTLVKSGSNPIYKDDCTLEVAPKKDFYAFNGNLRVDSDCNVEPGDWCPFTAK